LTAHEIAHDVPDVPLKTSSTGGGKLQAGTELPAAQKAVSRNANGNVVAQHTGGLAPFRGSEKPEKAPSGPVSDMPGMRAIPEGMTPTRTPNQTWPS